ncbi:MAG: hypothetical protein DI597_00870 [Pseudoxanthomonas spadix]|nr:MAG: hypothetical protein DI597_00870 [Pseudoxanthomonas spadix]
MSRLAFTLTDDGSQPTAGLPPDRNDCGQLPLVILHNNEGIEELAADIVRAELAGEITGPTQYPNYRGRQA